MKRAHRRAHLLLWLGLALLLPAIGVGALALRAGPPVLPPVRLGP